MPEYPSAPVHGTALSLVKVVISIVCAREPVDPLLTRTGT